MEEWRYNCGNQVALDECCLSAIRRSMSASTGSEIWFPLRRWTLRSFLFPSSSLRIISAPSSPMWLPSRSTLRTDSFCSSPSAMALRETFSSALWCNSNVVISVLCSRESAISAQPSASISLLPVRLRDVIPALALISLATEHAPSVVIPQAPNSSDFSAGWLSLPLPRVWFVPSPIAAVVGATWSRLDWSPTVLLSSDRGSLSSAMVLSFSRPSSLSSVTHVAASFTASSPDTNLSMPSSPSGFSCILHVHYISKILKTVNICDDDSCWLVNSSAKYYRYAPTWGMTRPSKIFWAAQLFYGTKQHLLYWHSY